MMRERPCIDVRALADVTGGDAALEGQLLRAFARMSAPDVDALRGAIERRDCPLAVQLAHRLRGASATLGAAQLAAVCARIERAARDGDIASLAGGVVELEAQYRRVLDHISGGTGDADR
jgi:HPt (histidine-containing phosphotransfer) domain-containing protein